MYKITGNEEIEIIGIRVLSDITFPQVYTIYIGEERPIFFNNRLILFGNIENAEKAIKTANCGAERLLTSPSREPSYIFDFVKVFDELSCKKNKIIHYDGFVSCLNLLEDFYFNTMKKSERLKDIYFLKIFSASFYFFEHKEITPFFTREGYERKELLDSIAYVIGKILLTAKYIV
ncbi:MAG: hypothetical protein LBJ67_15055 [Planctomycetaceae bacterium]|nr:hypothetical protein [Planctomycetaceae bacterium]